MRYDTHPAVGFHLEQPYVDSEPGALQQLEKSMALDELEFRDAWSLGYTDHYWDTAQGDLHSSSMALRFRESQDRPDKFIELKGTPKYLAPFVFARPYISQLVKDRSHAETIFNRAEPSIAMHVLTDMREDLYAAELHQSFSVDVQRTNVDLYSRKSGEGVCTLSFHSYTTTGSSGEVDNGRLLEVQPYCIRKHVGAFRRSEAVARYVKCFSFMRGALTGIGLKPSPAGKYQRVSRAAIDANSN